MDREFIRHVFPFVGNFKEQVGGAVRGDPDMVAQFAHAKVQLRKAIEDETSFGHYQVRPDNCYITCVLGHLHI